MKKLSTLIVALAVFLNQASAWAFPGEYGPLGKIVSIEIAHTTADLNLQYHGSMMLKTGAVTQEYRWGGVSCGSATLSPELVSVLVQTHLNKFRIAPHYKIGQGDLRCLMAFKIIK